MENLVFAPASVKGGDVFIPALGELQVSVSPYMPNLIEIAL
ncbi:MAG: hypothetical protein QXL59_08905 [Candidatus Jordarchaeales archaeon]